MTTLKELIENLTKLAEEHPANPDLPVYGTIGSSGVSYQLSTPSISFVNEWADGDVLELSAGDAYVDIYIGN